MRSRHIAFFTFLALLLFLQFSWLRPSTPSEDPWAEMGIERIGPSEPPGFVLEDTSGKTTSLNDFRGNVVLLNFWATWCKPCKEEMPALENLHSRLGGKGLAVVAIADYEPKEKVLKFLKRFPYTFKILFDEKGKTSEAYKAFLLPTTFVIDKEGMAVGKAIGPRQWDGGKSIMFFEELLTR
jgi:thiol-disulfide isomerase/thioredoxin